jgi:hypothetical protein
VPDYSNFIHSGRLFKNPRRGFPHADFHDRERSIFDQECGISGQECSIFDRENRDAELKVRILKQVLRENVLKQDISMGNTKGAITRI